MTTRNDEASVYEAEHLADDQPQDIQRIEADIEQTRQHLGDTVEALTAKLDLKGRAKHRIRALRGEAALRVDEMRTKAASLTSRTADAATDDHGKVKPGVSTVAALVAVAAAAATMIVLARRRSRR